jgi:hypothetical protein
MNQANGQTQQHLYTLQIVDGVKWWHKVGVNLGQRNITHFKLHILRTRKILTLFKYVEEILQDITNYDFNSLIPKIHDANGEFSFAS